MAPLKHLFGSLSLCFIMVPSVVAQEKPDIVHGNLIQFNENGTWSWYQDERAIIDSENGLLFVGSDGSERGLGGAPRNGNVDVVMYDLATGTSERNTFRNSGSDDHNVPAFLKMPNGNILAMYADHFDAFSRYRIWDGEGWSLEEQFDWDLPLQRTYSNLFYLSEEDRVYNISRADRKNPHIMVSDDYGQNWSYHGLLAEPHESVGSIGYVNGYFKYWSNGRDRVDFIATEYHPRDFNTSMYHGYIKGGKTYNSFGELLDDDISDQSAPQVPLFTPVFEANTVVNGQLMTRLWNHDIVTYEDGSIAALIKARSSDEDPDNESNDPEHVFFYSRFDGETWINTYLGRAGKKLYGSEQDYTGLGALDPNDPSTIYISSNYDPRDDTFLGVHEIFRGVTDDNGQSWIWTPVTENSTRDNLRPIVPAWDEEHTALLWWRGTYFTAQRTDAAVVGIIMESDKEPASKTYIDAAPNNTFLEDGSMVSPTGPTPEQGAADRRWHLRSGYGNGGSLYASSEIASENTPVLKTELPDGLETGIYDVWVNFWGKPTADWRIRAGLSTNKMMVFRHMASKTVNDNEYSSEIVTSQEDLHLYQAYAGRVVVSDQGRTPVVYIDDFPIPVGAGDTTPSGENERTWYDGISYSLVETGNFEPFNNPSESDDSVLNQNYPNPFSSTTRIRFEIQTSSNVRLDVYDVTGRLIRILQDGELPAGGHIRILNRENLSTGLYFYRMQVGDEIHVKAMTLIK